MILERATRLNPEDFQEVYRFNTSDQSETISEGISASITPYYFTIPDTLLPEGSAFYKVSTTQADD
ncbi:MAG: hypothetical protein ISR40_08310 [Puniceicoccaceae bacterium]|nr:hypothetical protein [Planctomycetota bacterium]MBL6913639.1 hypothetical protein [Puniceicoccaceae bacterium]